MRKSSAKKPIIVVGGLFVLLAGCVEERDPASEAPVDLLPGRYEITLSGNLPQNPNSKRAPTSLCVTGSKASNFHYHLAEEATKVFGACSPKRAPRVGNAFSGEISCLADQRMATGSNRFIYEGAISPEKVRIEARMKLDAKLKEGAGGDEVSDMQLKLAMKAMEAIKTIITAERVGDC